MAGPHCTKSTPSRCLWRAGNAPLPTGRPHRRSNRTVRATAALAALLLAALPAVAACSTTSSALNDPARTGTLEVVAAENMWGSLAAQLGGDRVRVTNLISNPDADPHDYEPTAADARAVATANLVIVNGAGYDPWATKLARADKPTGQVLLDVGELAGVAPGGNPHLWYSPTYVERFIDQVTAEYKALDPSHAAYYERMHRQLEDVGLARYHSLIDRIRIRYSGTPIGATESVFTYQAEALGLPLLTPERFLDAISEGNEPSAADKATVDHQISSRQIRVLVYNAQNATPDVSRLVDAARASGVAVTTVTETPTPAGASFQSWQARQLIDLEEALAHAPGR